METIASIWNRQFDINVPREYTPRDYIYATEIGKSNIDIALALKGVLPTNAPDTRAQRKFEAGEYFESIIKVALERVGVVKAYQKKVRYEKKGFIPVSGRIDYLIGGKVDWSSVIAKAESAFSFLPEKTQTVLRAIIDEMSKSNTEIEERIVDAKSLSLLVFNKRFEAQTPNESHYFQMLAYMFADQKAGELFYICRDDLRLLEFLIPLDDRGEHDLNKRLKEITEVVHSSELPQKERLFLWDGQKITHNWKIAYSNYLTMIYGFADESEYSTFARGLCSKFNNVIKRLAQKKEKTKNNIEMLAKMKEYFTDEEISLMVDERAIYLTKTDEELEELEESI